MPEEEEFVPDVVNYAIGLAPSRLDTLVLVLRTPQGEFPYAIDRRSALRLSEKLAEVAQKLTPPRFEN